MNTLVDLLGLTERRDIMLLREVSINFITENGNNTDFFLSIDEFLALFFILQHIIAPT